jgi:hypothetical protein
MSAPPILGGAPSSDFFYGPIIEGDVANANRRIRSTFVRIAICATPSYRSAPIFMTRARG